MNWDGSVTDRHLTVEGSRRVEYVQIARDVEFLVTHMLGDGMSVIDPGTKIWTTETAEDLRSRIEDDPQLGSDRTQWEKLDVQLRDASREVVLMAAELVFLREQPLYTASPETRRSHIEWVLTHLPGEYELPSSMVNCIERPTKIAGATAGQGYNGFLWRHLIWASTFVRHWSNLSDSDREAARRNPWALERVMLESGPDQPGIRSALQFLVAPGFFEPIVSMRMKESIRDALRNLIDESSDENHQVALDQDLYNIRLALSAKINGRFNFWDEGVKGHWAPNEPFLGTSPSPRTKHFWVLQIGPEASSWTYFYQNGVAALASEGIGDLAAYPDQKALQGAYSENGGSNLRCAPAPALWSFQHQMELEDVVYIANGPGEIIGRGTVASPPFFGERRGPYQNFRSIEWTNQGSWSLPEPLPTTPLTNLTPHHEVTEFLETAICGEKPFPPDPTSSPRQPYTREDFLREVYLPEDKYARLRSLVLRKKNVILTGPPGVGKTFAARRLAYSIIGKQDPDRIKIVQFHQSYSYEDFLMGYRPTESGGFSLAKGPFYRFCEQAREADEGEPYFFLIDEINRGNISKIFGELLMLIEADKRKEGIRLLYKDETFSVPPNVYIIGMMNTADRSLAVLDYALRRRFGFFEMKPAFDSEGFERWRQNAGSPALDRLIGTVKEINVAIARDPALGPGFEIGHSFLCNPEDVSIDNEWLTSVVEDELIPLLNEYWFDADEHVQRWSEELRAVFA